MAEYDYSGDVQFAIESVDEFGRLVRFQKTSAERDPVNPLGRPVEAPVVSDPVKAVFVTLAGTSNFGISKRTVELMKNSEQVALIAPSAVDYEEQTHMIDVDGSVWKIDVTDKFMPGNTPVLFFFGVSRP